MKKIHIYRGIPYITIGNLSLFSGSTKNYIIEIEKVFYPFSFLGINTPVILKKLISRESFIQYNHCFTQEAIDFVSHYVNVSYEYYSYRDGTKSNERILNKDEYYLLLNCYSKQDDSYVGDIATVAKKINKYGITTFYKNHIGFSETQKKWYGWSHRAIFGFTIGSMIKKGDCGYEPKDKKEFIESVLEWYEHDSHRVDKYEIPSSREYQDVLISWDKENKKELITDIPKTFGRGEWKAITLDDAKEMAIKFANSVA